MGKAAAKRHIYFSVVRSAKFAFSTSLSVYFSAKIVEKYEMCGKVLEKLPKEKSIP